MSQEPGRPEHEKIPSTGEFFAFDDEIPEPPGQLGASSEYLVPDEDPSNSPITPDPDDDVIDVPFSAPTARPEPVAAKATAAVPPLRKPAPLKSEPAPRKGSALPLFLGSLLLGAAGGGAYYVGDMLYKQRPAAETPPTVEGGNPEPTSVGTPTNATAAVPNAALDAIHGEINDLKTSLADLGSKLAALPKPETAPAVDLGPVRESIAALTKRVEALDALPEQIKGVESKVVSGARELADARKEIVELREALAAKPAAAETAAEPAKPVLADISAGVEDFAQARYADALAKFQALQASNPDDARVWYYSALANGLSKNQWSGPTETLVRRGIDREKAGTPPAAAITDAFKDLQRTTGKDWLEAYRRLAR